AARSRPRRPRRRPAARPRPGPARSGRPGSHRRRTAPPGPRAAPRSPPRRPGLVVLGSTAWHAPPPGAGAPASAVGTYLSESLQERGKPDTAICAALTTIRLRDSSRRAGAAALLRPRDDRAGPHTTLSSAPVSAVTLPSTLTSFVTTRSVG